MDLYIYKLIPDLSLVIGRSGKHVQIGSITASICCPAEESKGKISWCYPGSFTPGGVANELFIFQLVFSVIHKGIPGGRNGEWEMVNGE